MNGIDLKSGVNDCYWNVEGMCTHKKWYKNIPSGFSRNWDSTESCTLTQLGTQLCSNYMKEPLLGARK